MTGKANEARLIGMIVGVVVLNCGLAIEAAPALDVLGKCGIAELGRGGTS